MRFLNILLKIYYISRTKKKLKGHVKVYRIFYIHTCTTVPRSNTVSQSHRHGVTGGLSSLLEVMLLLQTFILLTFENMWKYSKEYLKNEQKSKHLIIQIDFKYLVLELVYSQEILNKRYYNNKYCIYKNVFINILSCDLFCINT